MSLIKKEGLLVVPETDVDIADDDVDVTDAEVDGGEIDEKDCGVDDTRDVSVRRWLCFCIGLTSCPCCRW